jgi:hypothetical protein
MVGFSFVWKYMKSNIEVTATDKHSSLFWYLITAEFFYSAGPQTQSYEVFYQA